MKKYLKLIIILLSIIILSTIAYVAVDKSTSNKEKEIASAGIVQLCDFETSDISRMVITNSSGTYDFAFKDDIWNWSNTEDAPFKCNTIILTQIADAMSSLSSNKVIEENADDISKYGFDNPMSIECYTSDGQQFSIEIGSKNPTSTSYYVIKSGENTVYTISAEKGDVLYSERNDLKSSYLLDVFVSEVTRIKLENQNGTVFDVQKDTDGIWQIKEPVSNVNTNLTKISSYSDLLVRATAYEFVEENPSDLSKYGLENPSYILNISTADENVRVLIGDEPEQYPQGVYVMIDTDSGVKDVTVFYRGNIGVLDADVSELISPIIYGYNINKISEINMSIEGQSVNLGIDSANEKYTFNGTSIEDEERISLYNEFFNSFNILEIADIDADAVPDTQQTPVLEINYVLTDGTEINTSYYSGENSDYLYYFKDGKYTGTTVKTANITAVKAAYTGILNRVSE